MTNTVVLIDHCDEPCGLGWAYFNCPVCGKNQDSGDVYMNQDEIYNGEDEKIICDGCRSELRVFWNKEELEYQIENINL